MSMTAWSPLFIRKGFLFWVVFRFFYSPLSSFFIITIFLLFVIEKYFDNMSPAVKSSSNSNSAEYKVQATRYFMICELQLVWSVCDAVGEPGRGVTHLAGAGGHARPPGPTHPWAGLPWGRAAGGQVPVSRGLDVFLYENLYENPLCKTIFYPSPKLLRYLHILFDIIFPLSIFFIFICVLFFKKYLYPIDPCK